MRHDQKMIRHGALIALTGFVLSGPVSVGLVVLLHPQPAWSLPDSFIEHYHFIQILPYLFGFILVAGLVMMMSAHYLQHKKSDSHVFRANSFLALVATVVFAALITFNYLCQTTFIHGLATNYKPGYAPLIEGFTMANPHSLSWSLEMWGYAIFGLATWLLSVTYAHRPLLKILLIMNGVASIAAAFYLILEAMWLMEPSGIIFYAGWNVLMIVILILILMDTRKGKNDPETNIIKAFLS